MRPRRPPRQRVPRVAFSSRRAPASSSATARAACRLFEPPCARVVFRDSACRVSPFRAAVRPRRLPRQRVPRVAFSGCRAPASFSAIARTAHRLFEPPRARVVFRDSACRASLFRTAAHPSRLSRQRVPRIAFSSRRAPASSSATARAACRLFEPPCARVVFRDRASRSSLFRTVARPRRLPRQRVPLVALSHRRAPTSSSATARAACRLFAPPCARVAFRDSVCRASPFHAAVRPRRLSRPRASRRSFTPPCARAVFRDSVRCTSPFRAAVRSRRLPRQRVPRVAFSHCRAPASLSATARAARRIFVPTARSRRSSRQRVPRATGTRLRRCPVSRSRF